MSYSMEIADSINNFLTKNNFDYIFDKEEGFFRFDISIKGKLKSISYIILLVKNDIVVYANSPIGADVDNADEMAEIAEFLHRANYSLMNGNFELNYNNGQIRFKFCVYCDNFIPDTSVIYNAIAVSLKPFEVYSNGIIGIMYGGMSARDAYNLCRE